MSEYLVIVLLGALVVLDTTVAGQFMVSQPLVSAALAGFFLGELESAIFVGAIMQVMWLKLIPAGGTIFLNGNLGTLTAVSVLALSAGTFPYPIEALQFTVIIFGIISSYIFGIFTYKKRIFNQLLVSRAHDSLRKGKLFQFQLCHFSGIFITGFAGSIITLIFTLLGTWIVSHLPHFYYSSLESYFSYGLYAFLGIGMGTVFSMAWSKKSWYYPLAGLCAGLWFVKF